jgi:hypothetical protein
MPSAVKGVSFRYPPCSGQHRLCTCQNQRGLRAGSSQRSKVAAPSRGLSRARLRVSCKSIKLRLYARPAQCAPSARRLPENWRSIASCVPGPAPFPALPGGYVETLADPEEVERYADLRNHASEALRLALGRLQALAPGIVAAALARFVSLLEVRNAAAIVRGETASSCFMTLVARGLEDERAWQDDASAAEAVDALTRFFRAMRQWGIASRHDEGAGAPSVLGDLVRRSATALDRDRDGVQRAEALARSAWRVGNVSDASATVLGAIANHDEEVGVIRANRFAAMAGAYRSDAGAAEEAASRVDDVARPFAGDRGFELQRAQAWRCVGYARLADPAGCEAAARLVDEIARPFAGERDFELERAQAWRYGGYAQAWRYVGSAPTADPAGCEAAARLVDEIARPFAGDRDFELQRAQAWRVVGDARRADPAECEAAARLVDEIARPFAGDRDFELQRAQAWNFVGLVPPDSPEGSEQRPGLTPYPDVAGTRGSGPAAGPRV